MSVPNKNDLCIAFGTLMFPSIALTSIINFQFIVDLFLNQYWEGVEYIRNISCNKLRRLIVEYIFSTNSEGERYAPNTLQTSKLIIASVKAASTFFNIMSISISHSEGARAPSYMLIVGCGYSKISFHFCKDCRIFCEGVKGNGIVKQKLEDKNQEGGMSTTAAVVKLNDLFGHNALVGCNNVGPIGLIIKINDLQRLVVDSIVILNCEGAVSVPITVSEGANAVPAISCNRSSKFIVALNSEGEMSKAESAYFGINGQISLIGLSGINNLKGFVNLNGLVSIRGFGLVSLVGLGGFGLVGVIGLSLISHYGLIGFISLGISFIGHGISLVSLSGFGLISLIGLSLAALIGHISLTGLICVIGFALISLVGLSGFGLIGLSGINSLIGQISLVNSLKFEIEMKPSQHDLFRRDSGLWCVWKVFSSLAGLDSVFLNALQNAKQLFHISLPQMTKYCVMRECENILCGYHYDGDLVFVILKKIYG
jgi:hypothetical protein